MQRVGCADAGRDEVEGKAAFPALQGLCASPGMDLAARLLASAASVLRPLGVVFDLDRHGQVLRSGRHARPMHRAASLQC